MKASLAVILSAVIFLMCFRVCRAEPLAVGFVKTVSGDALIVRNNTPIKATQAAKLEQGDMLETKIDGKMGIIFEDDTVISMGPNSKLMIQDFLFHPAENKMAFAAKLLQGTLSYLSGQIAKLSPGSVRLKTPDATIGIRGTHVLLKVK